MSYNIELEKGYIIIIIFKNIIFFFMVFILLKITSNIENTIVMRYKQYWFNDIHKRINNTNKLKVCLCTLGKKENKYIREFISHYNKYGIDKIFLYDNNNINDERFDNVILDYTNNNYVKILNYRGMKAPQFKIFSDCYKKNNMKYDWLLFYDIDEYINLKDYNNIKDFLSEKKFINCKLIYLDCLRHTDNNLLYYDNRTLAERFPFINWNSNMITVKSMIRGNIKNVRFKTSHWLDRSIYGCNSFGEIIKPSNLKKLGKLNSYNSNNPKYYYIDHYCFKSTEEYVNKIIINLHFVKLIVYVKSI